jgi:hypothetical protein
MGYIKEPKGVDFVVDPTPLSAAEQKRISDIIAYYKRTGRKKTFLKGSTRKSKPGAKAPKEVA